MSSEWLLAAVVLLTAAAALVDWRTGHIPNQLVLGGLCVGSALQLLLQWTRADGPFDALGAFALNVFGGAVLCALVPLLLYRLKALGGGDVKLFITLGAMTGPLIGLQVLLYSLVVAALYGPVKLVYEGRLLRALASSGTLIANAFRPLERQKPVPREALTSIRLGPLVFVATCLVAAFSWRAV